MPLPIPTGILRRLQDTLYTARHSEDVAPIPTAIDSESATSTGESSSMNGVETQSVLEDLPVNSLNDRAPYFNLDNLSSPSAEGMASRQELEEASTSHAAERRRQSLTSVSTPDPNAQTLLRKRILEIQSSPTLSEHSKAQRVQVYLLFKLHMTKPF